MSSQFCMAFTIIPTAFCLLLFLKYCFWWKVIFPSSLFCTLVNFMNVECCLIVFKFFAIFFSLLKKIWSYVLLLLLWHTASWNKIYLFDLNFEKHWDQYLIGTTTNREAITDKLLSGKYIFTDLFLTIGTPTTRKKRGPNNWAVGCAANAGGICRHVRWGRGL